MIGPDKGVPWHGRKAEALRDDIPEVGLRPETRRSLLVEPYFQGLCLSRATGFICRTKRGPVLITNWHVVTGRNAQTEECLRRDAAIPDRLRIYHNAEHPDGWMCWESRDELLIDQDGNPRWIEHPLLGRKADMVAVPLMPSAGLIIFDYDPSKPGPNMDLHPTQRISVVGFPFGQTSMGYLPIWVTGFIASEPELDWQGDRPAFLIDCRTRKGLSGAPVLALAEGSVTHQGRMLIDPGLRTRFLGVYSGRISKESDIGIVWRAEALAQLIASIPP